MNIHSVTLVGIGIVVGFVIGAVYVIVGSLFLGCHMGTPGGSE